MQKAKSKKIIQAAVAIAVVLTFMMPVSAMFAYKDDMSSLRGQVRSPITQRYTVSGDIPITVETLEYDGGSSQGNDGEGNFWICPTVAYGLYQLRDWRIRLWGCHVWDFIFFDGRPHVMNAEMDVLLYFQNGGISGTHIVSDAEWHGYHIIPWGLGVCIEVVDPVAYPLDYITIEGWKTVDGVTKDYYKELHDMPLWL